METRQKTLPIVCSLDSQELQDRKETTLKTLFEKVQETKRLAGGIAFRFEASDGLLASIVEVINKERKCCRFLDFQLQVTADEGPVWLTLSGPEGAVPFLEEILGAK